MMMIIITWMEMRCKALSLLSLLLSFLFCMVVWLLLLVLKPFFYPSFPLCYPLWHDTVLWIRMVLALSPNWWMSGLSLWFPKYSSTGSWQKRSVIIIHTFLEQELCALNCRMDGDVKTLIGLPGQEHFGPGILGVVTRSIWVLVLQDCKNSKNVIPNSNYKNKFN